jgi:N utilization substance protein A
MKINSQELLLILSQLEREKGIQQEVLIEAIEAALVTAAKKMYGSNTDVYAKFDKASGSIEIYQRKKVSLKVEDATLEISLLDARTLDPECMPGDEVEIEIDANEFGRIASQTAKQVIVQKLREAEREMVYKTYSGRVGEVINGIVHGFSRGSIIVDLGRAEAEMPSKEQVPRERFKQGDRIKALILEVKQNAKGPQVVLSRSSIAYLLRLFEQEVPEVAEKLVEIRTAAREPGSRSKIAVVSHAPNIDPVGACVGVKGSRVQAVVNELRGERIDIIPWTTDPAHFVSSALSPAQVTRVIINEKEHTMLVVVGDEELSLAIGKNGQNVRLAARLTGWNITIKSDSQLEKEKEAAIAAQAVAERAEAELHLLDGIPAAAAGHLHAAGFDTMDSVSRATDGELRAVEGVGPRTVEKLRERAPYRPAPDPAPVPELAEGDPAEGGELPDKPGTSPVEPVESAEGEPEPEPEEPAAHPEASDVTGAGAEKAAGGEAPTGDAAGAEGDREKPE